MDLSFLFAGLGIDHGQVPACQVQGGLQLKDALVDIDCLAVVALAGALFPNEASLLRLVSAILCEISNEWATSKPHLSMNLTDLPQT